MFFYNVNLQGRAWEIHWERKGEHGKYIGKEKVSMGNTLGKKR
jgi:hypothetical protein